MGADVEESPTGELEQNNVPFNIDDFSEQIELRFVPKDEPNELLIHELESVFRDAANRVFFAKSNNRLLPAEDQGIRLRAILDQRKEEIREKAAKAESRSMEFKIKIADDGDAATALEIRYAKELIKKTVHDLHEESGILLVARVDSRL